MLFLAFKYAVLADVAANKGNVIEELIYSSMMTIAFKQWKCQLDVKLLTA